MAREPWQPNEIYLQARAAIDAVLFRHGYQAHSERCDPHAFGNVLAVYRPPSRGRYVGLPWDGRDGDLIA